MSLPIRLACVAALLVVATTPLCAQRRTTVVKGPKGKVHVVHPRTRVVWRTNDRVIFRNYFHTHRIVFVPLRVEVARLVVIGKPLPVTVVRTPMPRDLVVLLAPPPTGYQYFIVGDRVVIVDDVGMVSDILLDVFDR